MIAPGLPTWTVAEDPYGCPTIWDEQHVPVATMDVDIVLNERHRALVWQVLTRVLAPDGATVERLAETVHDAYLDTCQRLGWSVKPDNDVPYNLLSDAAQALDRGTVYAVLAALAGTSAQTRHTADDPAGGDEDG